MYLLVGGGEESYDLGFKDIRWELGVFFGGWFICEAAFLNDGEYILWLALREITSGRFSPISTSIFRRRL